MAKKFTGKNSLGGLRLELNEEQEVLKLLKKKEMSLAKLQRYLIREWLKQQRDHKSGVLKLTT